LSLVAILDDDVEESDWNVDYGIVVETMFDGFALSPFDVDYLVVRCVVGAFVVSNQNPHYPRKTTTSQSRI
jgi:hypothetical protein